VTGIAVRHMGKKISGFALRTWRRRSAEETDVAIPEAPASLDEDRAVAGLPEGLANAADGFAQAFIVDFFSFPKPVKQLLSGHHPVAILDQVFKHQKGFALKRNGAVAEGELAFLNIEMSRT
jgi:hypothetical protein